MTNIDNDLYFFWCFPTISSILTVVEFNNFTLFFYYNHFTINYNFYDSRNNYFHQLWDKSLKFVGSVESRWELPWNTILGLLYTTMHLTNFNNHSVKHRVSAQCTVGRDENRLQCCDVFIVFHSCVCLTCLTSAKRRLKERYLSAFSYVYTIVWINDDYTG